MPIVRMFSGTISRKLKVTEDGSNIFHGGKIHVFIGESAE